MPQQKGSAKELKQNNDAMVASMGKKNPGENLRAQEKTCPCCNKFVRIDVECGHCGHRFRYKCEDTTEEHVKNHYPEDIQCL